MNRVAFDGAIGFPFGMKTRVLLGPRYTGLITSLLRLHAVLVGHGVENATDWTEGHQVFHR